MRQIATLTIAAAFVALGLAVAPPPAAAAEPCCGIQSVDTRTGIVTAIDRATGQSFQFQVTNPAQLQGLRPGQPVYGNAASGRVGLTQAAPCCSVVGRSGADWAGRWRPRGSAGWAGRWRPRGGAGWAGRCPNRAAHLGRPPLSPSAGNGAISPLTPTLSPPAGRGRAGSPPEKYWPMLLPCRAARPCQTKGFSDLRRADQRWRASSRRTTPASVTQLSWMERRSPICA